MVTHQLQVEHRTGKVRQSETDVLPLCHATNRIHWYGDNRRYSRLNTYPYSITERKVPELIPVLDSQPAGDVSHKPDGRLPLLSARPAVTPATLKRVATHFAAW